MIGAKPLRLFCKGFAPIVSFVGSANLISGPGGGHPAFPFFGFHLFYSIAQGGAWHRCVMRRKEMAQHLYVPLSHFAQYPAYGLVNEVVGMMEQLSVYVFTSSGVLLLLQKDLSR